MRQLHLRPTSRSKKRDGPKSDQASIAAALKAIRCLLGLSTTGCQKRMPRQGDVCRGKGSDDTFRGRGKDVSEEVVYVPAARNSVTGVTSCAAKDRPVDNSLDGLPGPDELAFDPTPTRGGRSWPNVRRDQRYKSAQNREEETRPNAVRHARLHRQRRLQRPSPNMRQ